MVELLLHEKVDTQARDKKQQTPLHYAKSFNRSEMVELLLKHKDDTESRYK